MQTFWSRRGWLNRLLLPLSWLFGVVAGLRRLFYRKRIINAAHPGVPVIIVGNLGAGGSGKTPFVIWLVQWLKQRGYRPGVVSRGYGRKCKTLHVLADNSSPAQAGDEPLLIFQTTQVPVVVARDRLQACAALRQQYPEVDILIADDGLQHYCLQRDVELVLADADSLFGNGWLLPAGPLREPVTRLAQADALILSQRGNADMPAPAAPVPVFNVRHQPGRFYNLKQPARVAAADYFRGAEVEAVAGIARPQAFFTSLQADGITIHARPFSDHHAYVAGEIDPAATVVMTAKDAVKCRHLAGEEWWVRTLELNPDPALETWLAATLARLSNESSQYG